MLNIGHYNELTVQRRVDFGFYLGNEEDEVLLPVKYAPDDLRTGDTLRVFVYNDSEDRPIATTLAPDGEVGDFVWLQVKDNTPVGSFLDWGLEKDLLAPKSEQKMPMKKGESYVVKICLDHRTSRIYATSHIPGNCDKNIEALTEGDKVALLIYDIADPGIMAVVNNRYHGMLYHNETYQKLTPGENVTAYIHKIRDDGKLDLIIKKPGYHSVKGSSEIILEALTASDGFLPLNDKSDPADIKNQFAMSKKEFKRAISALYKDRVITIMDNGIALSAD